MVSARKNIRSVFFKTNKFRYVKLILTTIFKELTGEEETLQNPHSSHS
jgi:hypothetical protein